MWALISFGNSWRIGIDEKRAGSLVTNGIFIFSWNPIFAFIDLYFLGTFLLNGGPVFLVFVIVTMLALHYQISQEEKFLLKKYGQAYERYCRRVGRYATWKTSLWKRASEELTKMETMERTLAGEGQIFALTMLVWLGTGKASGRLRR